VSPARRPKRFLPFADLQGLARGAVVSNDDRAPALRLVEPVNRACVAGPGGACLACDAPQGEPCRRQPGNT
jgi:hypothetical protein